MKFSLTDNQKETLKVVLTSLLLVVCMALFFDSCVTRCSSEKLREENLELEKEIELQEINNKLDSINYDLQELEDSLQKLKENEKVKIISIPDISLDSLERWIWAE